MTMDPSVPHQAPELDADAIPSIEPFPGLRPFREDETHLYFGRELHRAEVLKRLSATRFVAVVGTSGSGKSSLIRAGLLPDLYCGYLPGTGSDWVVIDMAPGHDPIGRMAAKFTEAGWPVDPGALRTNSTQLLDLADQYLQPGQHLVVLVDQLEELFRLKTSDHPTIDADEKASFVRLLLNAGGQRAEVPSQGNPRVHVIIAMRSEFLGRASAYRGLPEAIDQGQYLIPRLSREQLRRAIECPVRVADGEIEEMLIQRLLNELGDDQDQLPVLQHALMRVWHFWTARGRTGKLDDEAYLQCGGFEKALSLDATDALAETTRAMGDRGARIVERTFQALRETDVSGGQTRRPTKVSDLLDIAECSREDLTTALAPFRQRSFVFPSPPAPLDDAVILDVSHEALLRRWDTLKKWIDDDDRDRRLYVRIAYRADDERNAERPDYFAPPLLPVLVKFWADRRPPRAWAIRHHPEYELARAFLDSSERHQRELDEADARRTRELAEAKAKGARTKERAVAGALLAIVLLVLGGLIIKNQFEQGRVLAAQGDALAAQLIAAKAAGLAESNVETRIQLAAESVRREPTLDAQQLLLGSILVAARPLPDIRSSDGVPLGSADAVALSPAGDVLYLVMGDQLKAIEVPSGKPRFSVPMAQVTKSDTPLPMAAGQKLILFDDSVSIVDGLTGRLLMPAAIETVRAISVSSDGTKAAFLDDEGIHLCDLVDNCATMVAHKLPKNFAGEDLVLSPDGQLLVVLGDRDVDGQESHQIVLFRTRKWEQVKEQAVAELGNVVGLGLDNTHAWVCSATTLARYDVYDYSLDKADRRQFPSEAKACVHTMDRLVTAHEDGTVRVWDGGLNMVTMAGSAVGGWSDLALAGNWLVTSGDRVRVWDIKRFGLRPEVPRGSKFARAASHVFDGVRLYELDSGQITDRSDVGKAPAGMYRLAVSDSLEHAMYAPLQGAGTSLELAFAALRPGTSPRVLWRFESAGEAAKRSTRGQRSYHAEQPPRVSISPDDRYVAIHGEDVTHVLDAATGVVVREIKGADSVQFTATPNEVLVQNPESAEVWPLPGGTPRALPKEATLGTSAVAALTFSTDGQLVAVAAESSGADDTQSSSQRTWQVRILKWPGLERVAEFQHPARVTSLAFRADSRALLALTVTSTIHVWDLDARRETARLSAPSGSREEVTVAFTPSGQVAINDASGLTILPADPAGWVGEACTRIVRNLTPQEWTVFLGPRVPYFKTCADRP